MKKEEVKSIEFFTQKSELSKVNLNEVRGGQAIQDYATGCPQQHHMSYQSEARISMH